MQNIKQTTYIFLSCTSLILSSDAQGKKEILPDDMKKVICKINHFNQKKVHGRSYKVVDASSNKATQKTEKPHIVMTEYNEVAFYSRKIDHDEHNTIQTNKLNNKNAKSSVNNIKEYKDTRNRTRGKTTTMEVYVKPSAEVKGRAGIPLIIEAEANTRIEGHVGAKKVREDKKEHTVDFGDRDESVTDAGDTSTQRDIIEDGTSQYPVIQRRTYEGSIKVEYNQPLKDVLKKRPFDIVELGDALNHGVSLLDLKADLKNCFITKEFESKEAAKKHFVKKISNFKKTYNQEDEDWPNKIEYFEDYDREGLQTKPKSMYYLILAEKYFLKNKMSRNFYITESIKGQKQKIYFFHKEYKTADRKDLEKMKSNN